MINKYRKRPVEVEAAQFDGWNWREVRQFISNEPLMFTQDFRKEEYLFMSLDIEVSSASSMQVIDFTSVRGAERLYRSP